MGHGTSTYSSGGAPRAAAGNSVGSGSLHFDADDADLLGARGISCGNNKPWSQGASPRQLAVLVRLVRAVEPDFADKLAETILTRFGSLARLLSASPATLTRNIENATLARIIPALRGVVVEALREDSVNARFDLRDPKIITYLIAQLGLETEEHFHVAFLDAYHRLIQEECVASGGWTQVDVRLRGLMRRAVDLNAANLVLIHNHPSGVAEPSADDVELTRQAIKVAAALGMHIVDHLVIAGPELFSMRKAGLL